MIDWKEPWSELWQPSNSFEIELTKELRDGHVLYGTETHCIGRREDRDDFLFEVSGERLKYAVVHLTYSGGKESDTKLPITIVYENIDEFIHRMNEDNKEYMR